MKFTETFIKDVFVIEPKVWQDERGYFYESYNKKLFSEAGIQADFLQDNQSLSQKGTLRGLHAQAPPAAQGKLVRVIRGSVLDIAVDIRRESPTYGQYIAETLTEENFKMFWIPPGFLHGFVTLEDNTIFSYKVTNLYDHKAEIGVLWNDPELNIDWEISAECVILSAKDKTQSSFRTFKSPF